MLVLVAISDLSYVILPVLFIMRLNMRLSRKIGIALLISVSLMTAAVEISKFVLGELALKDTGPLVEDYQSGRIVGLIFMLSQIEQCLVIIAGCVPTLGPLAKTHTATLSWLGNSLVQLITRRSRSMKNSPNRSLVVEDIELAPKVRLADDNSDRVTVSAKPSKQDMGPESRILHAHDDILITQEFSMHSRAGGE